VRKWAYTAVRAHRGGIYNTWLEEVTKQCLSVNEAFLEALPYSEIKATAKSIATYCWKKDAYCYQEFIDRQSRKGKIGGKKSNSSNGGKKRAQQYEDQKKKAMELKQEGLSNTEIARLVKVSRRTIINWFKGE
jgi:hypothetical protein